MKLKITFGAFLLLCCLCAGAQKKQPVADTLKKVPPTLTDTTVLFSYTDYMDFEKEVLYNLPTRYTDPIRQWWAIRTRQRALEYGQKKTGAVNTGQ